MPWLICATQCLRASASGSRRKIDRYRFRTSRSRSLAIAVAMLPYLCFLLLKEPSNPSSSPRGQKLSRGPGGIVYLIKKHAVELDFGSSRFLSVFAKYLIDQV